MSVPAAGSPDDPNPAEPAASAPVSLAKRPPAPGAAPGDGPAWQYAPPPSRAPLSVRGVLAETLFAVAVAVVVAAFGFPLAWLWARVGPHVHLVMTENGPAFADTNQEAYVGGESTYVLLSIGAGVGFAIVAWLLVRRRRGPVVLVGLAVGAVVGGAVMAWFGHRIGLREYEHLLSDAPVGTRFDRPVQVRSMKLELDPPRVQGAVLVQAIAAVAMYATIAGFYATPTLRPHRRVTAPPDGVSSGWSAPPAPPAAPVPPAAG